MALSMANDIVVINTLEGGDRLFSRRLACIECGISMPEMTPRAFSFNSPHGACPDCQGLGATQDFDPNRIVPDQTKSLLEGAIVPWARGDRKLVREAIAGLGKNLGFDPATPFAALPKKARDQILYGGNGKGFEGIIPNLRRRFDEGVVERAGGSRGVSFAAAVSRVPRRAAEGAEPCGEGEEPDDLGVRQSSHQRRVRRVQPRWSSANARI